MCVDKKTRGIRNNNPLNIRRSKSAWLGKKPFSRSTDSVFEQFIEMEFGIRAGLKLLQTYIKKYKLCSVYSIVNRWSPASDGNDVSSYVSIVTDYMEMNQLNPYYITGNLNELSVLFIAMSRVECGVYFDLAYVCEICRKYKIN